MELLFFRLLDFDFDLPFLLDGEACSFDALLPFLGFSGFYFSDACEAVFFFATFSNLGLVWTRSALGLFGPCRFLWSEMTFLSMAAN